MHLLLCKLYEIRGFIHKYYLYLYKRVSDGFSLFYENNIIIYSNASYVYDLYYYNIQYAKSIPPGGRRVYTYYIMSSASIN